MEFDKFISALEVKGYKNRKLKVEDIDRMIREEEYNLFPDNYVQMIDFIEDSTVTEQLRKIFV